MKVATWSIRKNTWPSLAGYSNFVSYTVSSYLHSRIKYFYYLYLQKYVNNCYRWNIYIKRPIFHTFEGCHGNYSLLGNLRPVRGVPWSSCSECSFSFENYQEIIQTKWAIKSIEDTSFKCQKNAYTCTKYLSIELLFSERCGLITCNGVCKHTNWITRVIHTHHDLVIWSCYA